MKALTITEFDDGRFQPSHHYSQRDKAMRSVTRINTPAEHAAALARIDALMGATPDSPEEAELALLADLVDEYEKTQFPIDLLRTVAEL